MNCSLKDINSTKQEIEEYNKDMEALTKALEILV